MKHLFVTTLLTLGLTSTTLFAGEYKLGDLVIETPYTRTTPPMTPVGGGFLTITNNGKETAKLIGGKAEFAQVVEIHEMTMTENIMKMRQLKDGLEIPAGETVELKPGGYHLMFIRLAEQMKEGDHHKATLNFGTAGEIEVEFVVRDITKMMGHMDKDTTDNSKHKGMKHKAEETGHKMMDHNRHKHGDAEKSE